MVIRWLLVPLEWCAQSLRPRDVYRHDRESQRQWNKCGGIHWAIWEGKQALHHYRSHRYLARNGRVVAQSKYLFKRTNYSNFSFSAFAWEIRQLFVQDWWKRLRTQVESYPEGVHWVCPVQSRRLTLVSVWEQYCRAPHNERHRWRVSASCTPPQRLLCRTCKWISVQKTLS